MSIKRLQSFEFSRFEPRRLLTTASYDPNTSAILIEGTNADDLIVITSNPSELTVEARLNGFLQPIYQRRSQDGPIEQIEVRTYGGDDEVRDEDQTYPSYVWLGNGNDRYTQLRFNQLGNGNRSAPTYVSGGPGNDDFSSHRKKTLPDVFFGDEGNDTFLLMGGDFGYGGPGDDIFNVGFKRFATGSGPIPDLAVDSDSVFGQDGNDEVNVFDSGNHFIDVGVGNDEVNFIHNFGKSRIVLGPGNDFVQIRERPDNTPFYSRNNFWGNEGDDVFELWGNSGENFIAGNDGNDSLEVLDFPSFDASDKVVFYGGNGNDRAETRGGDDRLFGDEGNDYLYGGMGNDFIRGGVGHDVLKGGEGDDELFGDDGSDSLFGGKGEDVLRGGNGRDGLIGGGHLGADKLDGGFHDDRILMQWNDTFLRHQSIDSVFMFINGDQDWTDSEIDAIDDGLRRLHYSTDNGRLLHPYFQINFLENADFRFYRYVSNGNNAARTKLANGGWALPVVEFFDSAFTTSYNHIRDGKDVAHIVAHELAHQWHFASESAVGRALASYGSLVYGGNNVGNVHYRFANGMMKEYGWILTPNNPNDFLDGNYIQAQASRTRQNFFWWYDSSVAHVDNYSKTSPAETWGEVFGVYFFGTTVARQVAGSKLDYVSQFLSTF